MDRLNWTLNYLPNPFSEPDPSVAELWGRLDITVETAAGVETLLQIQWDLGGFIEAFIERKAELFTNELPEMLLGETLAEADARLIQTDMDDEQELDAFLDRLYQFRSIHSLRLWLRGTDTPNIYVGMNQGVGEISSVATTSENLNPNPVFKPGRWAFYFDPDAFMESLTSEAIAFLKTWENESMNEYQKSSVARLLRGI